MTQKLFTFFLLSIAPLALVWGQCTTPFISEYVEGSNNNKAIEIANPSDKDLDLSDYRLIRWQNGSAVYDAAFSIDLTGITVKAKDVVVLVIDKQDCTKTGQDTCVFADLKAQTDYYICPDYNVSSTMYFNGNDAMSLNKISDNGQMPFGAFVDIFGLIGEDPGQSWTDTYPYTQAAGGAYWTRDQTLIRKPGITQGVTTNPGTPYTGAWNPTAEWDSLPRNTFNQLGFHQCDCGMLAGINNHNPLANNFTMYPNPTTGNLYFEAPKLVSQVQILTLAGLETTAIKPNSQKFTLNTSDLPQGTYFVKLQYIDKTMYLRKVVVQ